MPHHASAQHFLRKYRDAFRAVCCQHGATQRRLDELLQAMGAPPLVARRGEAVVPRALAAAHEARVAFAERRQAAARRVPEWARALLSRMRTPQGMAAQCQERRERADDKV
jgi:hypothetical protein